MLGLPGQGGQEVSALLWKQWEKVNCMSQNTRNTASLRVSIHSAHFLRLVKPLTTECGKAAGRCTTALHFSDSSLWAWMNQQEDCWIDHSGILLQTYPLSLYIPVCNSAQVNAACNISLLSLLHSGSENRATSVTQTVTWSARSLLVDALVLSSWLVSGDRWDEYKCYSCLHLGFRLPPAFTT